MTELDVVDPFVVRGKKSELALQVTRFSTAVLGAYGISVLFHSTAGLGVPDVAGLQRCVFFFQAEDGIRDADVTGVQTCALPIFLAININQKITIRNLTAFS